MAATSSIQVVVVLLQQLDADGLPNKAPCSPSDTIVVVVILQQSEVNDGRLNNERWLFGIVVFDSLLVDVIVERVPHLGVDDGRPNNVRISPSGAELPPVPSTR